MTGAARRTAVVGAGISGLTAAHILGKRDEVTLFEADGRLGGHAHTHDVAGAGRTHAVDSGFIVHNDRTYPHLLRLFRDLGVSTQEAEMSLSVRCDGCGLEYAGARGPRGLFARPATALRPAALRMFAEVPRFHRRARAVLRSTGGDRQTLGAFLAEGRFSRYFTGHFMTPLVSAVWSCAPATALRYPARYLFQFLDHHGLLSVTGSPVWRTVRGGSRSYVERLAKHLPAVRTDTPVRAVRRTADGVEIVTDDGAAHSFDSVVIATHADQALRLLADPSDAERTVLGAFRYSRNVTVLHTDDSQLPRAGSAAASWNYWLPSCHAQPGQVHVSYDMTRLQRLPRRPGEDRYLVSLNAGDRVDPDRVIAAMVYEHPVYTTESVAAQLRLPALSGPVTAYAGAYHGWGFHEDGCRSGVRAAAALGVDW
ncbi:NAD(P)/FAD-dependent oxidoreductase [Streptomyces harbinensis]|uniref:NAD(P)/FAD-dependent oxidoreductase n=1 Tax=Streptomyces harbinensis TaxID=1176198 RepID=UPI0034DF5C23